MNSNGPIIVGGCYRSGTSLVRRLLDSHPRIHCGPEVKFFRDLDADYLGVEDPIAHLRFMTTARSLVGEESALRILGGAFVELHEQAARDAGKPRWADKTPENIVFLDRWEELLGGGWTFVHVARNPLDTLASIAEVGFPRSVPEGLGDRIGLYVEYHAAGLEFAGRSPDRYVRVLYEDLVDDPEAALGRLMVALGERPHPAQLRINSTPHQEGLEDPKAPLASEVHRRSVGRWAQVFNAATAREISSRTAEVWSRLDPDRRHRDVIAPLPAPSSGAG